MFHIEKAHYIVDEMVSNGVIVENNKINILRPLALMDQLSEKWNVNKIKTITILKCRKDRKNACQKIELQTHVRKNKINIKMRTKINVMIKNVAKIITNMKTANKSDTIIEITTSKFIFICCNFLHFL